ncbi:uncharacterized protein L969DRAFT_89427 [Mixia osmundae IAM 14324]|uniref:Transcriptional coactivator p15 (PC4) C-terminal domain-containing protein n=1 Tax=Mixia osmundae (strain CBS 9802 / IAM 14324 / JCM 22182 / KY 12970) TaxID=764103 RepID=G7DWQ8_MIXOS|nr:uncharacterized protein L969DRAFT_91208 [Mixia osmundae IAM 14324]XP_014566742.1 uncharacterized protein L969DRAFT_89427 [Mixia osmundae IAM 14324]KEI36217.1 hypothetical protein L969DRAFT_91208 [Mixia osmundae IAM 14324]KEI38185.1 hypothetical protein L969DRAFT_89427 [Mixia osmundae IAM 14324]GAA95005.1 hypothetical protein E5Q_01660 [Mixia osmundae IAM 14324]
MNGFIVDDEQASDGSYDGRNDVKQETRDRSSSSDILKAIRAQKAAEQAQRKDDESSSEAATDSDGEKPKKKKAKVAEKKPKKEAKAKAKEPKAKKETKKGASAKASSSSMQRNTDGEGYVLLSGSRRVTVRVYNGKPLIDIRETYEKDGKVLPGKKGISLNADQWAALSDPVTTSAVNAELARVS